MIQRKPLYYGQMPILMNLVPGCFNMKNQYTFQAKLTEAPQGYVAIELESLAVAWVMEKFHHFLYGK